MFRLIAIIIACLFPVLAYAQATNGNGMGVSLEVRPAWLTTKCNFHEGQLNLDAKNTQVVFGFSASRPGWYSLQYWVLPGFHQEEVFTNPVSLVIGNTDFSQKQHQSGGSKKDKAVQVDWTVPIGHRAELAIDYGFRGLRPAFVAEIAGWKIEATGENKDGRVVTDSEAFKRICVGAGASCHYASQQTILSCLAAFGDRYQVAEGSISRKLWSDFAIGGGYTYRKVQFPGGLELRQSGPFATLELTF